ncbi:MULTISPECIES: restriction endonuclease subunit S [Acinetobacter calcoaceticus/baumannii complex]|uniref:restriction endonuclease subunit S n=1 Tax=Acinetobacter calcoaceticus/baumannii complex TaxID=909768 RepID=UPI0022EAF3C1|nr:restriction endonuclease subunit S [Acinetobacter baumannii]MDA3433852.1 restriction endonuclease subunit S [Acinetobacter baumannii]
MKNWKVAQFKDVAQIYTGKTPSTANPEYYGNSIPFVSPADLNNSILNTSKNYLSVLGADQVCRVPKDTVLVSCIGYLGKVAIVNQEVCFNQQLNALVFDKNKIFPKYGFYYAQTIGAQLEKLSSSTTVPIVNKSRFSTIEIKYPDIDEQRRIASILDKADDIRQKRQQAIAKLDELLQATFIDMFGDPIKNEKGWTIGTIGDMLESVKYGSSDKAELEGDVPILRMNNITYSGEMNLKDLKYIKQEQADEKYLVRQGDILFNRTNSKELVGKTAVYYGPEPMAYAGYLVRGRTLPEHVPEYISGFLNSSWGKSTLQSMCKSIIGMANINAKEFQSIRLPIPPSELQLQFKKKVYAIRELKLKLEIQLHQYDELFNALQQKAFNGTL